ncbi:MAG TPA: hypothetical protein VFK57_09670 [Vicinamibacterales bacterium]|nr:hypothetical protein [Vicinamibacterales bacterium]
MDQRLHLLIVDRRRGTALAARYGPRWLWPTIACGERVRAGLAAARWCAARGLAADIAGQWLGRIDAGVSDWLIAVAARGARSGAVAPLEWIELDALLDAASVLDYQTWALARCVRRGAMPEVDGPFGNLDWPAHVGEWIRAAVDSDVREWIPYRISAHELVLGVETARTRVFFKGLTGARTSEACITQTLCAALPDSFAPTLALAPRPAATVWWLTGFCTGHACRDASLVATALARVQQRLALSTGDGCSLDPLPIERAAAWAAAAPAGIERDLTIDACAHVMDASPARSWIPMDLDPSNVVADGDRVRFIDVDDSFAGPAPLALAAFARRCGDRSGYAAYELAWSPPLEGIDWRRHEIAAAVFQAWSGLESFRRNAARGELRAAPDEVELRVRKRLAMELHRR